MVKKQNTPPSYETLIRRIPLDYSKAAAKLGAKVKGIREAIGASVADATRAMGLHQQKYYLLVENGRAWPTEEWARRFVAWAWRNESFAAAPMAPVDLRKRRDHGGVESAVRVVFDDKEVYQALRKKARDLGVSMSALAISAMKSYLEEGRYVTTTAQLIREAERLRIESILQRNPSIITILDGDPLLAKFIHRTEPERPVTEFASVAVTHADTSSYVASILNAPGDGPSSEILTPYLERLLEV